MATTETVQRLKTRAELADNIITQLRLQIAQLKQAKAASACSEAEEKLTFENESLKKEVEALKKDLIFAEIHNGVKQVFPPADRTVARSANGDAQPPPSANTATTKKETEAESKPQQAKGDSNAAKKQNQEETDSKPSKPKKEKKAPPPAADVKIDVSRLDLRVGHIVSAKKHPNADRLYVEDVNLGEEKNRTIVSGLAGKVPLEQMQDRLAVFMVNLKPVKMQGIQSEGMIMCVSDGDTIEILVPPQGSEIGDRVTCSDYAGVPDAQLNPKKKVWEQVKPYMKTNADKAACYRGSPFSVSGKGPLLAPSLANGQIS